jgi:hypothetical protein
MIRQRPLVVGAGGVHGVPLYASPLASSASI